MSNWNSSIWVGFRGLIDTAEADFDYFQIEFLGEFEAICEKASLWIRGLGGLIDEKTEARKSCGLSL
jgi:hypothetical protein